MFRKLRIRFILIASAAIICILFLLVGVLNSARFLQVNGEIRSVLNILSDNDGDFPSIEETAQGLNNDRITIDTIYQYRYFSLVLNKDGSVYSSNLEHISNVSEEQARQYVRRVVSFGKTQGTFNVGSQIYSYQITKIKNSNRSLVVILDATNYIEDRNDFLWLSIQLSIYSLIFFILIVSVVSSYAIRPYVRNYEKQKRFITNAGHELKTPLAIISANTELQEMMAGENEWSQSTKDQVSRLNGLISQLISLARLDEQPDIALRELDISSLVKKASSDFKSLIEQKGYQYHVDIQEGLEVRASEHELYELVSILLDNACKYCDEGGQILVSLRKPKRRRRVQLRISNTYAAGSEIDYSRFFDRFYREDESHNSQQAGYGIGLSMAESLVQLFKGKISVHYKEGMITFLILL